MIWHILPVNDLKTHTKESTCECKPRVVILEEGDIQVIHSAYDKREQIEELIYNTSKQ